MRAYLGITKDLPTQPQYLHVLAFNSKGRELLAEMKKVATMPIITRYAGINDERMKKLFDKEAQITDIYSLGFKSIRNCGEEQRAKVEIL